MFEFYIALSSNLFLDFFSFLYVPSFKLFGRNTEGYDVFFEYLLNSI